MSGTRETASSPAAGRFLYGSPPGEARDPVSQKERSSLELAGRWPEIRIEPVDVPNPVRLALAGNDLDIVSRLVQLLRREKGFEVVGPCRDRNHLVFTLAAFRPGVFLLGANPASLTGALSLLRGLRIRALRPRVVLVGAAVPEARLLEAVHLGVHGVVSGEIAPGALAKCIHRVHAGGLWLGVPELDHELLWSIGQLERRDPILRGILTR